LSRIEAGALKISNHPFSIKKVISEVVGLVRPQCLKKNLDLKVNTSLPELVSGDEVRVRQILMNLAGNAVKFTQEGYIEISASIVADCLELSVKDSGIGIPKELHGKLFESFQQLDQSITKKFGGSGLGLAISKKLLDAMNGTIEIQSEIGEGTTFIVRLPMSETAERRTSNRQEQGANLSGMTVLVVEDNAINLKIIRTLLEGFGAKCLTAGNGLIAIEQVKSLEKIDVILM